MINGRSIRLLAVAPIVALLFETATAQSVSAQGVPESRLAPAEASFQWHEAQRQDAIARQLDLNYRMIRLAGYGPRYPNPFEPWPRVPGDIWGYPSPRPIEHPVGHLSAQTGPNRWIYRPVYAAEVPSSLSNFDKQGSDGGSRSVLPPARPGPSDAAELPSDAAPPRLKTRGPRAF